MTAAESQRYVHLGGHSIEVAACGKENPFAAYYKSAVQLRQFFDRSAEIQIEKYGAMTRDAPTTDPRSMV